MIKNEVLNNLLENLKEPLEMCILAEEQDPDFILAREIFEQLLDELEAIKE